MERGAWRAMKALVKGLTLSFFHTLTVTQQQAKWHMHRYHDSSKADHTGKKVGGGPIHGNLHSFPQRAGILLLFRLRNYPPI